MKESEEKFLQAYALFKAYIIRKKKAEERKTREKRAEKPRRLEKESDRENTYRIPQKEEEISTKATENKGKTANCRKSAINI